MHRLWICWLHHRTYRREKQVQTHHEFVILTENIPCQVHHTSEPVRVDPSRCSLTQENQADNLIPTEEGLLQNIRKVVNSWKYMQTKLLKVNEKLYPNSLKRKLTRDYFLKNKEIKYFPRQNPRLWCGSHVQNGQTLPCVNSTDKIQSQKYGNSAYKSRTSLASSRIGRSRTSPSRNSWQNFSRSGRNKESSRLADGRTSSTRITGKSVHSERSYSSRSGIARQDELHDRLQRVPRCRITVQFDIIPRSLSTCNCSEFLWNAQPRCLLACDLIHGT